MGFTYNPLLKAGLDQVGAGGGASVAGSDTQVQYNNSGSFGASADLTWDDTGKVLGVGGDINLDDGGTYSTTLQMVTPTANRTISFPDATGTVGLVAGSNGQVIYNSSGANAGLATVTTDGTNVTLTGRFISSLNGAASAPPGTFTGTWFTGGTTTTTKPQVLIEPAGATSTAWSTSGTGLGVNAPSGFGGNLLDLQLNGTRILSASPNSTNGVVLDAATGFGLGYDIRSAGSFRVGIRSDRLQLATGVALFFGVANHSSAIAQTRLQSPSNNVLEQINDTNAQKTNIYDTYTSSTDYHRVTIATARATLSNVSGASVTATGLIPAGAVVMGVTSKVTTGLGTTNSTTGYKIGTGADDDRWGDITGTAAGTTSDNRNWTAGTIECFPAATDVIVTAVGGNFDATGDIYLSVQYMAGEAD